MNLLPITENNIKFEHMPTRHHTVIFRLWGMVSCKKIAKVLETEEANIYETAKNMGLNTEPTNFKNWQERGYITIIKALWHLMPYEQIMDVLDWDEMRLSYVLKEDDFLGIKLGSQKPYCEKVIYRKPNEEEKEREKEIYRIMQNTVNKFENTKLKSKPFDFFNLPYKNSAMQKDFDVSITSHWCIEGEHSPEISAYIDDFKKFAYERFEIKLSQHSSKKISIETEKNMRNDEDHIIRIDDNCITIKAKAPIGVMRALYYLMRKASEVNSLSFEKGTYKRNVKVKSRIIYSYCGLYTDVLDKPSEISFPEELLFEYAMREINGIWIQAVLYKLVPFKYDESISEGWEKRIENLNNLISRAKRYGIKVYLYINEPRSMPLSFFEKYPMLKGHDNKDGYAAMCTSLKDVQEYVYDAFVSLASKAPDLGGFWNICMSENLTHCLSRDDVEANCPRCKGRNPLELAAEITAVMVNAVHSVNPDMKFFVHTWAFNAFSKQEIEKFIASVPSSAIIVAVSESGMPFEINGISCSVDDYTMSRVGPGQWAKNIWAAAHKNGLETCAKIQINTTWECSTAPFLPVYEKVIRHLDNLSKENIEHMFLSWTLGGYVSDNLKIASIYFFDEENTIEQAYDNILRNNYGEYASNVKAAAHMFAEGFSEYPFCIEHIYFGPSNLGVANLFFKEKTGFEATMTAFPYDDVKTWCGPYDAETVIKQYEKLCAKWEEGLKFIKDMPDCEFKDAAYYGYYLFKSSLNQLNFYALRDENKNSEICNVVKNELDASKEVYKILTRNCTIGYEAANHYYVSKTMIAEKIIQCNYLISKIK